MTSVVIDVTFVNPSSTEVRDDISSYRCNNPSSTEVRDDISSYRCNIRQP
jgi:hypothetical protein